ncbi:hypothetical protein [Ideonella livida]|uniref:Uncharacterized protein n=1 Tax=Ideonella livida TaxID=2707176 RepID=A0A7C9TP01_9BURK|nr:hypothetical protein [Ideonella livida]NDY93066.1 hypothetical protein [Ideonella livida]
MSGRFAFLHSLWINTMPCCAATPPLQRLGLLAASLALVPALALAQYPGRQFPRDALRAEAVFGTPPQVTLAKQALTLSPGARVRNELNQYVPAGTLTGQKRTIHYTLDITGQLRDVWLLRAEEIANLPWPSTLEQAQTWTFNPSTQTWTRP